MDLDDLLPGNTKRARATAVNAFRRFIQSEDVDLETIILYLAILATRAGGVGEGLDKRNDSVLTAVIGRNSVLAIVRRVKMCNCVLFPSCRPSSTIRWKTIVVFFYVICTTLVLCSSCVPFCLKRPKGWRLDLLWYGIVSIRTCALQYGLLPVPS
uniref:AlNc14C317G10552 protein n=1 Tax=Albugo laibachii Nc14 TaxID=890382 RepID=F0WWB7_9STRA|nr:AlNc14C317G10552 [Albugo laibachii Nc14]|eukprot:CCA25737.1 AlNc14C317G10552 [Albugo laibachii Nc14]